MLLSGDGNDGTDATNARYSLSELPDAWHNADAPALRHLDGANYAFADGHVKSMKPTSTYSRNQFNMWAVNTSLNLTSTVIPSNLATAEAAAARRSDDRTDPPETGLD